MTNIFSRDYHVLPMFTAYGSAIADSGAIERAAVWVLFNPRTGQTVRLANCPANLCTFHAYLKASWTLTNEDESLAGYAEPAAPRSLKTDGRAAMTDGTENEG
jgi:hypothetical protein